MIKKYYKAGKVRIENQLNKIILKGNKVNCKMCGWNGIKFPKIKCPNCKSLPRTRLISFSIDYFGIALNDKKVLHIAPNISEYKYIKNNFSLKKYDRLDIRKYEHINIVKDLKNTNLKDHSYDFILLWHVLEHIPDDIKAIKEMHRLLTPNGLILTSVPIYPNNNNKTYEDSNIKRSDYLKIHGHDDHCRSCGFDYYQRFENLGFSTKTLIIKELEENLIKKFGLSKNHRSWLFKKNTNANNGYN